MTRENIPVKNGFEYDIYFPKAKGGSITKKKGATVSDTIAFIPKVVAENKRHTARFAKEVIKADSVYNTCKNIWEFVFNHIAYKKDEDGKEQIRTPARTWRDRHNTDSNGQPSGVDCDCYTVFISSILSNLGIKHVLRITKYEEDHFQHIYPIVPLENGGYITLDAVVTKFNYEEPYTQKHDTAMDLEYLNGVTNAANNTNQYSEDLLGMMSEKEALMELGKIFKKKNASSSSGGSGNTNKNRPKLFQRKTAEQKQVRKEKVKQFLKKGLHVTNRLNPATAAIRGGVLAAMKINFMQIASELKYTYLSDSRASQMSIDMRRFVKMRQVREKLEKLFYGAGGKPENLKKAILTGKGNRNREVPINGLGYVTDYNIDGLNDDMPLSQFLGREMYTSEAMHEVNGLGELGEPATAASIAAASTILTTIVGLIKSVGSIVPKRKVPANKTRGNNSSSTESNSEESNTSPEVSNSTSNTEDAETSNPPGEKESTTSTPVNTYTSPSNAASNSESSSSNETDNSSDSKETSTSNEDVNGAKNSINESETNSGAAANRDAATNAEKSTTTKLSFWDKHKKWIKPTGIAVGSIGLIALAYQLFKPKSKPTLKGVPTKQTTETENKSLKKKGGQSKLPKSKKKTSSLKRPKSKKKMAVTLM